MIARLLFLSALLLAGCSSRLTKPASGVMLVNALSPEDAKNHVDLGAVVTAQPSEFNGDEADAREQLRVSAARNGADIVVIERETREPCELNRTTNCVHLRGRAYKPGNPAELAALAQPAPEQLDSQLKKKTKQRKKQSRR